MFAAAGRGLRYARAAVITCRVVRRGTLEDQIPFDATAVETARNDGHRVWLDVVDPTDDELRTLQQELGLHELAVEDSRNWGQRAKVDFYPTHLFLVAHGLEIDRSGEFVDREVHLFAAERQFLVTVRREPLFDFTKVHGRLGIESEVAGEGMGYLLYLLLDEIVDGYLDTIERLEDLSDEIEDAVAGQEEGSDAEATRVLAQRIFHLRQKVVRFRRLASPMREAVDLVLESSRIATEPLKPYYRDVLDHVIRSLELTDNVRDLLTSARELQLAQVSNRLNVVMKQLSAWAAIILIPTLIAGIYGMNFEHMPELGWVFGYPFALGIMVVAAFLLYRTFRKRQWL
jgi:magnesium transporter